MSGLVTCAIGLVAASAPCGHLAARVALSRGGPAASSSTKTTTVEVAATAVAWLAAVALAAPTLRWLCVTSTTFAFAAALAMLPLAVRLLAVGTSSASPEGAGLRARSLGPIRAPLGGPGAIVAVAAYSVRFDPGVAAIAAGIAMVVVAAVSSAGVRRDPPGLGALRWLGRGSGLLLLGAAVELGLYAFRAV